MLNSTIHFFPIIAYALSSLLLLRHIQQGKNKGLALAFSPAIIGILLHSYNATEHLHPLNLSSSAMIELISAIVVIIFLLACIVMPIRRLGILVFPFTILSLLFAQLWHSQSQPPANQSALFDMHILISILAYAFLAIACFQAILFSYQERSIKNHSKSILNRTLPPLQTMEDLLFRLLGLGFLLLSLTLLTGTLFSQQIFGHAFVFKHHTVLTLLAWLVFALLLYQHKRNGLRGSQAVIWTVSGFLLIQLGYFGTKLITESLKLH